MLQENQKKKSFGTNSYLHQYILFSLPDILGNVILPDPDHQKIKFTGEANS